MLQPDRAALKDRASRLAAAKEMRAAKRSEFEASTHASPEERRRRRTERTQERNRIRRQRSTTRSAAPGVFSSHGIDWPEEAHLDEQRGAIAQYNINEKLAEDAANDYQRLEQQWGMLALSRETLTDTNVI